MEMLKGKNVVLGVTAGIAAYKAVEVTSRLRKSGANVHVIMTKNAAEFVTPLTFREISGNPVVVSMWEKVTNWNVEHIALAQLADVMLIAPATANIIGKLANGIADDMLSTTIMATTAPVFIAPAMNSNMFNNRIVQSNLRRLAEFGYHIIAPATGHLACQVDGVGRLPEPEELVERLQNFFAASSELTGRKVLITAAGTIEPIDPVRFIGNRSSGKMGYAIAAAARKRGANVVLVSGPSSLDAPGGVKLIKVETTQEMRDAVLAEFQDSAIIIKAAAVADYKPTVVSANKIKKTADVFSIELEKNPDILLELGRIKRPEQFLVGFAAETQELLKYAQDKLRRKNLDMIVANDVSAPNVGFNSDTNAVKILYRDGQIDELPLMAKTAVAESLLDKILAKYKN